MMMIECGERKKYDYLNSFRKDNKYEKYIKIVLSYIS